MSSAAIHALSVCAASDILGDIGRRLHILTHDDLLVIRPFSFRSIGSLKRQPKAKCLKLFILKAWPGIVGSRVVEAVERFRGKTFDCIARWAIGTMGANV